MNRELIVAIDCGNDLLKLVWSLDTGTKSKKVSMRTIISEVDGDEEGCFIYESGDDTTRVGSAWVNEIGHRQLRVMSDDFGKPKLILPIVTSAMWKDLKDKDVLYVVASIHNKAALGDELNKALEGKHKITLNKKKPETKEIEIKVLQIVNEGLGAIIQANQDGLLSGRANALLDLGCDTFIFSVFDGLKLIPGCPPYSEKREGTRMLISDFAKSDPVSRKLGDGKQLTYDQARAIVESSTHNFTKGSKEIDLSKALESEVDRWLSKVLFKVDQMMGHHLNNVNGLFATGGACNLSYVKDYLEKKEYTVLEDSQWANALGLHQYARRQYEKLFSQIEGEN